ncbi:hypothetical protein BDZ97DRAFT_1820257 [Flammula alnicola]|nr:hypothetical protein BDZ97DRAFT_1820257 [Flammula alnicola]
MQHGESNGDKLMRILFIDDPSYTDSALQAKDGRPMLNNTALQLHRQFGVPLAFFQHMSLTLEYRSTGSGYFRRYNDKDEIVAVDGLYHLSQGLDDRPAYIWFSYSVLESHSSTYMIYNCSEVAKRLIITCAETQDPRSLLRPFVVDTFLIEDLLETWTIKVSKFRTRLIQYEHDATIFSHTPSQNAKAVADLHNLSQHFNVVVGNLVDFKERVEFFFSAREQYLRLSSARFRVPERSVDSISDSLRLLSSRAGMLMTWASNYNERTKIRINMFFNLTTQGDSRTNLDIARLTTKIAVAAQKDSSSMITIAAVTMFFLPGSFVSALFSMVFFNSQTTATGQTILSVTPQWWLFPSITIPLTILVFIIWLLWQRRRNSVLKEIGFRNQGVRDEPDEPDESLSHYSEKI